MGPPCYGSQVRHLPTPSPTTFLQRPSYRYCSTQHDVDVLVRGIKTGLKIARTEPLASMLDENDKHEELDHALHLKSDAELAQVARERVETLYHPACSCRMAPLEEGGVVDSRFKVHGTTNLRVCDASVFPSIVSGHTVSTLLHYFVRKTDRLNRLPHASHWRRNLPM